MLTGIDLGTTNSLIAYYTEDGAKIIPNRLNKSLTPSVVSIDEEGTIYVGETAKERMAVYPMETAEIFKRSMGTNKEFELSGKKYTAEELSSFILRSLKEDAEAYLNQEITEAIISVPAYFNDAQRKATKKAGELAGFKVERIISEPTAAAISYGLYQKDANTKFLVFDLGGGTFDVSILELYKNIMEVRAVAGDNYIGGDDFTQIIYQMFINKKKIDETSLDLKTTLYIKRQAELCKISFENSKTSVMKCVINGEIHEYAMNIDDYEQACQLLLAKIRKPIERSLKDANIKLKEIDEIILVGGATKLPIIRKFVSIFFGRLPNTSINPDEAVALGSAIQCGMKERNKAVKEMILTDVCPFTLGTEVVKTRYDNFKETGHFLPIIERNTVIPVSRTETLYTAYNNQTKINVQILQGESRFAKNNIYLGELSVRVPSRKEGEEAIDVTYTYDINSILEVEVKVKSTGESKKVILQKEDSNMTEEEVINRLEELSYLKIHPRDQEENKLLLFKGERLYEECIGPLRLEVERIMFKFEEILDKQDRHQIERARKEVSEALKYIEDMNMEA